MHSRNRESNKKWMRAIATSGLALAALALAGAAEAHDRGHRHHHAHGGHGVHGDSRHHGAGRARVREARRYDRRLDRRGEAIDFQLDLLAFIAAANGEYALAEHLDRKGDRIERRLDRKGDRALRGARNDRRSGRDHDWKRSKRERRWEKERRIDRKIARERDRDRERRISRNRDCDRDLSHVDALSIRARGRVR
ncbi:MAG: hypothetical protein NXI30_24870 [bacterium]|nr:hypothetical protein [bacterium]